MKVYKTDKYEIPVEPLFEKNEVFERVPYNQDILNNLEKGSLRTYLED